MLSMTLEQFYKNYFTKYPKSSYRLGQYFCDVFLEDNSSAKSIHPLYEETDVENCKDMIWKIILDKGWDVGNLQVLREELI